MTIPREKIAGQRYDLATIDLVCAAGLPGTEDLDVAAYLARLDMWTEAIRFKTSRFWPSYTSDPARFFHNENVYRVEFMCYCLTEDYGVRYNANQREEFQWEFTNPNDEFICGQLGPERTGTCASLPKLAISIGRRLGYPLKFVHIPQHNFFRWDDGVQRFNADWNGLRVTYQDDDEYKKWPVRWTEKMEREFAADGVMLANMSPEREVAVCLASRAIVLVAHQRFEEAVELLDAAARIDPHHRGYMQERQRLYAEHAYNGPPHWYNQHWDHRDTPIRIYSPTLRMVPRRRLEDGDQRHATFPQMTNVFPGWHRRLAGAALLGELDLNLQRPLLHPVLKPQQRPEQEALSVCGRSVPTLAEILSADPEAFIAKYTDIAAIDLACAVGLPRAEDLDIPHQLAELDEMAEFVRFKTAQSWHVFRKAPELFDHCENMFRVKWMLYQLNKRWGLNYNPERHGGARYDPTDAGDHFIHGLLSRRRTGTCASLPVFAIAVGRRLGYPLKLVTVPMHSLFRWEDEQSRFNVEFGGFGANSHPDHNYKAWPLRWTPQMHKDTERFGEWLTSLSARREVAYSIDHRTRALVELGRFEEALECANAAQRFSPTSPFYRRLRTELLVKMAGAGDGTVPFVSIAPRGDRDGLTTIPNVFVTELFPAMMTMPPEYFDNVDHQMLWAVIVGTPTHVPTTCAAGHGEMYCANWYWNFHKDAAPIPSVEPPGTALLDALDIFRDRSKTYRRGMHVQISMVPRENEDHLHSHTLVIIQPKNKKTQTAKERAHGQQCSWFKLENWRD